MATRRKNDESSKQVNTQLISRLRKAERELLTVQTSLEKVNGTKSNLEQSIIVFDDKLSSLQKTAAASTRLTKQTVQAFLKFHQILVQQTQAIRKSVSRLTDEDEAEEDGDGDADAGDDSPSSQLSSDRRKREHSPASNVSSTSSHVRDNEVEENIQELSLEAIPALLHRYGENIEAFVMAHENLGHAIDLTMCRLRVEKEARLHTEANLCKARELQLEQQEILHELRDHMEEIVGLGDAEIQTDDEDNIGQSTMCRPWSPSSLDCIRQMCCKAMSVARDATAGAWVSVASRVKEGTSNNEPEEATDQEIYVYELSEASR